MKTTYSQRVAMDVWKREHPTATIAEGPSLMSNETFGPCLYFTARYGRTYIEHGIKPDGEMFTVN